MNQASLLDQISGLLRKGRLDEAEEVLGLFLPKTDMERKRKEALRSFSLLKRGNSDTYISGLVDYWMDSKSNPEAIIILSEAAIQLQKPSILRPFLSYCAKLQGKPSLEIPGLAIPALRPANIVIPQLQLLIPSLRENPDDIDLLITLIPLLCEVNLENQIIEILQALPREKTNNPWIKWFVEILTVTPIYTPSQVATQPINPPSNTKVSAPNTSASTHQKLADANAVLQAFWSGQQTPALQTLIEWAKSGEDPKLFEAALALQTSPALIKALLAYTESKNHWRAIFQIAKQAQKCGCLLAARLISDEIQIWQPEYWFARELPRQFDGYYSQLGQDVIIEEFFRINGAKNHRFVEIGAFDGTHYSNVRRLHEKYGWSGICIEPVRKNFQRLLDSYAGSNVKCLRAAASNKDGNLSIHVSTYPHLPEWGTDVASLEAKETSRWDKYGAIWSEEKVNVTTLNQILETEKIDDFDFMTVDAEGHDLAVLQGLDFKKYHPSLIVVEYSNDRNIILEYMESQGYTLYFDNKQDLFLQRLPSAKPVQLSEVSSLLNSHLLDIKYLDNTELVKKEIAAINLMVAERFDLSAKLFFARMHQSKADTSVGDDIYREHLRVFNNFSELEKNGYDAFKNSYTTLLDSMDQQGFDSSKGLIPIDQNGLMIDGAHRIASSILSQQRISVVQSSRTTNVYDFKWFKEKGLSEEAADTMALEFVRWNPTCRFVTIFPAAVGKEKELEDFISQSASILYKREDELINHGPALLIWQMYRHEVWIGEATQNWAGSLGKARGCFPNGRGVVKTYLIKPKANADLRLLKDNIRKLYNIENHSVHINDTYNETKVLASIFYNANSRHFLNNAKMQHMPTFWRLFTRFTSGLAKQQGNIDNFCIDGSAILSAYGLRDCRDLDFLHTGMDEFSFGNPDLIGSHNLNMSHHITSRDDILFHPRNHFYFHGVRFASLGVLAAMKQNRGEGKDATDLALIKSLAVAPQAPHIHTNKVTAPFVLKNRPAKIVGLLTTRNEEAVIAQCVKTYAPFVDALLVLDDASTDATVSILHSLKTECKIASLIQKKTWYRDEPGDRNRLLNAGRSIGGTHFIFLDADECFTSNLLDQNFLRNKILELQPGDILEMQWLQLWRSTSQYRADQSVWNNNYKPFVFCDNWSAFYTSEFIHTPRIPGGLNGKIFRLAGPAAGVLHFQFTQWNNLLLKQAWYRCMERMHTPEKPVAEINARYAPSKDETNLGLLPAPSEWFSKYPVFNHDIYKQPDHWRKEQVLAWFSQYGKEYFSGLDIWDIEWENESSANIKTSIHTSPINTTESTKPVYQPTIKTTLPTDGEIIAMYPIAPVVGAKSGLISWKGINGFLSQQDIVELYKAAFKLPKGATILEIGSFFGLSTVVLARALMDAGNTTAKISCIDLWENYYGSSLTAFISNCESAGVMHMITHIQENCTTAIRHFKNHSIDLLFVDGDHSYEGCFRDLDTYACVVKSDGLIYGHDYSHEYGGVVRAVLEFREKRPFFSLTEPKAGSAVFSLSPLPKKDGDVLVYIGLHKGDSFEKIFRNFRTCIGIEANPDLAKMVAEKYKDYPNVHILHAAATTFNGFVDLNLTNDGGGASSLGLLNSKFPGGSLAHSGKIQVPAIYIPDLLKKFNIAYISEYVSDIQGMDYTVLATLKDWIESQRIGRITCETCKDGFRNIYETLPSNELATFHKLLDQDYDVCGKGWGVIADGHFEEVPESWWEFDCRWAPKK